MEHFKRHILKKLTKINKETTSFFFFKVLSDFTVLEKQIIPYSLSLSQFSLYIFNC